MSNSSNHRRCLPSTLNIFFCLRVFLFIRIGVNALYVGAYSLSFSPYLRYISFHSPFESSVPPNSTLGLVQRQEQRIINGHPYDVERLSPLDQGHFSEAFQISDGFPSSPDPNAKRIPAILKITPVRLEPNADPDDSDEYEYAESEMMGNTEIEVEYLQRVSLTCSMFYVYLIDDSPPLICTSTLNGYLNPKLKNSAPPTSS